ncbi:MAG: helicase-related protein [Candidatus Cloacimonetes bacterium]|jgi:superfamily II DNA or RNA helicase|nr:helicase-related protein [Candidatus Cloacimonadota bacterium]
MPDSTDELLILKPLGGSDDEITGILTALEKVKPATFSLPDPTQLGDYQSCRLLRDALRLGFRNSAGPFRSFGRLAVDPRPYQLVPLMMALKLDPVRLLIADDVGIGKTIEAGLIARELVDRGEISRFCVLCPPHLAEQWQAELSSKFHLDAEMVLGSTVRRLERNCRANESIFEVYPYTVVSIDYIKTDRHKDEFIRTAPELIIVDEAHTASFDDVKRSSRHQRFDLIKRLSENPQRHILLVTATPHSGNEAAFRSLLTLLKSDVEFFPQDLSGTQNREHRRVIAQHFVQRRRADIEFFMGEKTEFPTAETKEIHYKLSEPYRDLFDKALKYAREIVRDQEGGQHRQRVRWWSALALLRALASSPAAAAATMRNRSATLETETATEANEIGRRLVLDIDDNDSTDASDILPGSDSHTQEDENVISHRKLTAMARAAEALFGEHDTKMLGLLKPLKDLIKEEYSPIIFCRFIQTAEYLAEQLRERLPKSIQIAAVTGLLPPEERELRVKELAEHPSRILVCTDCLSEGINLQERFNAVIHYDLSWNPTRHEQREGRVDRFGQKRDIVRMITYYGIDNQVDGIVLDVLLRKHRQIKSSLGISVPFPADTDAVLEAIFEGLLLREQSGSSEQLVIAGFEEYFKEDKKKLHDAWENAKEKEKRSRTMFAQEGLTARVDEIKAELESIRDSIGSQLSIRDFVRQTLLRYKASIKEVKNSYQIDLSPVPKLIKESCGYLPDKLTVTFDLPAQDKEIYLSRTHPIVEGLADLVMATALDSESQHAVASRAGVIRTTAVERRTTLLLLRYRFHLTQFFEDKKPYRSLVEDSQIVAFTGTPENPEWLSEPKAKALLLAMPSANVLPQQAQEQIQRIITNHSLLTSHLNTFAQSRATELLDSHQNVREVMLMKRSQKPEIKPELPPDVLGIYVYLPGGE